MRLFPCVMEAVSGGARRILLPLCVILLLLCPAHLRAQEDIDTEEPIPSSVGEIISPMGRLAEKKPVRPGFFPWLKEQLKDTSPFFRDTKVDLNLRTYYLLRSNYDASVNEALAYGGALSYKSGWLYDRFRVGATLYTSQPVYAPEDRDGTGLLQTEQKGFTVPGQIYGQVRLLEETHLNLYRYGDFNTPYLSQHDNRMAPYSFEGYTIQGKVGGKEGAPRLNFGGGYITRIRDKTSERFVWMSEKAGAEAKRGVAVLGALVNYAGLSLGAIDYYSDDIINIGYAEAGYRLDLPDGAGVRLTAQYTDQRCVGRNLLKGNFFSTYQTGVKTDVGYGGGILSLAWTFNAKGADLQNPWSGFPGFTSSMITNYSKAGLNAFSAKLSYDFSKVGLDGVAAYALFTHGWGKVDPSTRESLPNENEFDGDIQWRPTWSYLKGLWVRFRYGVVYQYQAPKSYTHTCRVIVNYDLPLM